MTTHRIPEFLQIPEDIYHADPRIGHSMLRMFAGSRIAFRDSMQQETNAAMATGKASHIALIEPHRVKEFYISKFKTRCPSMQEEQDANPGRLVVTQTEMDDALEIAETIEAHPVCWSLLKRVTHREASVHAEIDGVLCKCRPDLLIAPERIMLDAKTARDYDTFFREYLKDSYLAGARTPGYAVTQGGHYNRCSGGGWKFGIILCVKKPRPEACVIWISERTLEVGAKWCSDQLIEIKACIAGEIPWAMPWSRWEQEFDHEDGLQFVHQQLTKGGEIMRGL